MTRSKAEYLDFPTFLAALPASDIRRLEETGLVFCYPVLFENDFELIEPPVSQRMLMATCQSAGCRVSSEIIRVSGGDILFPPEATNDAPSYVIIHPMISILDVLSEIISACRERFPGAQIVLQNSDQHQHEKVIGGPESAAIAAYLLERQPNLDWIIRGFAEHALISLILGRPTQVVSGQNGAGTVEEKFFTMESLPLAEMPQEGDRDISTRSIRVQRARGCLSGCTYCIEGQANRSTSSERPWDGVSVENFVNRLSRLEEQGYFFINLIDSSFEDPGHRGLDDLRRFCDLVLERRMRFSFKMHLRAENALKLDTADLDALKMAGVDVLIVGLESGNQAELSFLRKIATKEINVKAAEHLDAPQTFCNIFGHMMISPTVSQSDIIEKVSFLRDINRSWDFLNLTNRVLVFWGSTLHRQLESLGLIRPGQVKLGYVQYDFQHAEVEALDARINALKQRRPEFMRLNNLIYDAMNLESRFLNPANAPYLAQAGSAYHDFRAALRNRHSRLNDMYSTAFEQFALGRDDEFLSSFDAHQEADQQLEEIRTLLGVFSKQEKPPETLFLHTWLSAVNYLGVKNVA